MSMNVTIGSPRTAATVYIVDDDDAVRESLCWLMSSVSLPARGYSNARAFLADWNPATPGCLVLDMQMPGLNGLELQQELVRAGQEIPILFLSGQSDIPTAVRAMHAGAVEFITKPYSERFLLERVQAALEGDVEQRRRRREQQVLDARYAVLTPREREVLLRVVAGRVNREIAAELGISAKTVELHRGNVMRKMHAESLAALTADCMRIAECRRALGLPEAA